jgi:diguanylate cyclase (GGDEF)-like protein/PAS domain S-box-containing protein
VAFGAAVTSLLVLAAVSYRSAQRASASTQWIVHTEQVLRQLNVVRSDVAESDAALRAFTLTGDARFLNAFEKLVDRPLADLKNVGQLTRDNPRQQQSLAHVDSLLTEKNAATRRIADLRRSNDVEAVAQIVRTKDEPLSNDIRRRLQDMTLEERSLLDERFARSATDSQVMSTLRLVGFAISLALLLASFWILNRALTDQKRLETQHETFFRVSLDMLALAGLDGYFTRLNPAWEKTLGFTTKELMSKPYIEFVHPDDRESTLVKATALMSGATTVSFENRYLCKDGTHKWLLWNAVPIPDQDIIYAVARDLTAHKASEERLRDLSLTDELTSLRNRRGFLLLAEQEMKLVRDRRRKDNDVHLWVVFADLDGLKQINDQFGHNVGSQAIVQTARVLTKIFRDADVIARLGGDEFAILALNNEPDAGDKMTSRVEAAMRRFNAEVQPPYCLSLSVGSVKVDSGVASIEELLEEADRRMYERKRTKKATAVVDAGPPM